MSRDAEKDMEQQTETFLRETFGQSWFRHFRSWKVIFLLAVTSFDMYFATVLSGGYRDFMWFATGTTLTYAICSVTQQVVLEAMVVMSREVRELVRLLPWPKEQREMIEKTMTHNDRR